VLRKANFLGTGYRTIARHLNTNKATRRDGKLVYLFKKELDAQLKKQLLAANPTIADSRNAQTKV
jgi:hypothetical protein